MGIGRCVVTSSVFVLALPVFLLAQAIDRPIKTLKDLEEARDRPLYSNCEPVRATVTIQLNLSGVDSDLANALESTLKQQAKDTLQRAGIWTDLRELGPQLSISAAAVQSSAVEGSLGAVLLSVRLMKPVTDDYGNRLLSPVWGHEVAVPANAGQLIVDFLQRATSDFAIKYLRVNSDACPYTE